MKLSNNYKTVLFYGRILHVKKRCFLFCCQRRRGDLYLQYQTNLYV